ncbi:uncharacterized protein LOC143618821 [Bidens hawaiensis]|uniref:uncharacterized protein LOC143618821 n=1 Tax=Bidens hawaiensis TaxID=980011 RepID=UPI00404B3F64
MIHDALKTFLNNLNYTFVGVGADSNEEKLFSEYSLKLMNTVDLGAKATYKLNEQDLSGYDPQLLTIQFLRKQVDPEKLEAALRLSDWDSDQLPHDQVLYGCSSLGTVDDGFGELCWLG